MGRRAKVEVRKAVRTAAWFCTTDKLDKVKAVTKPVSGDKKSGEILKNVKRPFCYLEQAVSRVTV